MLLSSPRCSLPDARILKTVPVFSIYKNWSIVVVRIHIKKKNDSVTRHLSTTSSTISELFIQQETRLTTAPVIGRYNTRELTTKTSTKKTERGGIYEILST